MAASGDVLHSVRLDAGLRWMAWMAPATTSHWSNVASVPGAACQTATLHIDGLVDVL
jgi:hypothetical protein